MSKIKNWFSNMLPMDKPYVYQGVSYRTTEHFYQAMKLPKDKIDLRREISEMNPYEAKKAIRNKEKYPCRENWEQDKLSIMEYILRIKFAPGTSWAKKLLATGDEEIVEINDWRDTFWGYDINLKQGENHLGKLLIKIRNELKS